MRVLIALGGNAMTGPDGSAAPGDQDRAVVLAMERVADLVGQRGRRAADPRQRAPGGQPAGEERAGGARRPARPARLVRRADPGHDRLPRARRAGGSARRPRCRPAGRDRGDAHPRRRRRPRLRAADEAHRPLPAGGPGACPDGARPDLGGPGRAGAGVAWSRHPNRRRSSTRPRSRCSRTPASSSSAREAVASRSYAGRTARCAVSRPSSTRTCPRHCWPGPSAPRCW